MGLVKKAKELSQKYSPKRSIFFERKVELSMNSNDRTYSHEQARPPGSFTYMPFRKCERNQLSERWLEKPLQWGRVTINSRLTETEAR